MGGVAADAELDALKEAAEAEIVSANNLLGCYAPLLAAICHNRYGQGQDFVAVLLSVVSWCILEACSVLANNSGLF